MAFVVSSPRAAMKLNRPIHSTPRCAQHSPNQETSRPLGAAALGIATAALVTSLHVAQAIELPKLQLPSLPSVSIPGLPGLPDFSKSAPDQRPKDVSSDLSQEEQGRVDDMMTKLQAKKKAQISKM